MYMPSQFVQIIRRAKVTKPFSIVVIRHDHTTALKWVSWSSTEYHMMMPRRKKRSWMPQ